MKVMNKALKIACLGLNIPSTRAVFFRFPGPSEASFYEITFGPIEHDLRVKDDMNKFM